ncbi:MAG: hypothetical protein ACM3MF_00545 [Anaerolineae bacterium]
MNIVSRRFVGAILAGIFIGLLEVLFVAPSAWAYLAGIMAAATLASVSCPREGAVVGTIVMLPVGLASILLQPQVQALEPSASTLVILGLASTLGIVVFGAIGALSGLGIGKLLQITKEHVLFL